MSSSKKCLFEKFPAMARGLQTQIGDFGVRAPESPSLPFSGIVYGRDAADKDGNEAVRQGRIA